MKNIFVLISLSLFISCSSNKEFMDFKDNAFIVDQDRVIAYFEKDILTENRMNEIVDTINLGIELFNELINGPLEWQKYNEQQITYYFKPGRFVSHTTKLNEIEIPIAWYKAGVTSPWLHETVHILLRPEEGFWWPMNVSSFFIMPQWFTEGMAEYLAMRISNESNLPKEEGLMIGNILTVDSICSSYLKGEHGQYILNYIGEPGFMLKLKGRNGMEYIPTFYGCSCSFTKYIAETYGLSILLTAYSKYKNEQKTIEELTGKIMEELKAEWLNTIGYN